MKPGIGDIVRIEDAGDVFMADFAGETDLGGGLCLTPDGESTNSEEKRACGG